MINHQNGRIKLFTICTLFYYLRDQRVLYVVNVIICPNIFAISHVQQTIQTNALLHAITFTILTIRRYFNYIFDIRFYRISLDITETLSI